MKDQFKEEPSKRLLNIKFILENKTWLDEPNRIDFRRQKNIYADAGELFKFFERAAKHTIARSFLGGLKLEPDASVSVPVLYLTPGRSVRAPVFDDARM